MAAGAGPEEGSIRAAPTYTAKVRRCPDCGSSSPSRARFCPDCGRSLGAGARREVRKVVTILFCDVMGSTGLGERLDPEVLPRVIGSYFEQMREALLRHGGTVQKFIGDAVVAVFGIPDLHEDDALRAVRAAVDMLAELELLNDHLDRVWGVRLQMRIGINTGEVLTGDPTLGDSLLVGDAVNVAARLEQSAGPGEILIAPATYGLVRDAVHVEAVGSLALKGRRETVSPLRLVRLIPGVSGHSRRMTAPLVGRQAELRVFAAAFERARRERSCQVLTVVGAAGVGKTRLLVEAVAAVSGEATVITAECPDYGAGITFWPLAQTMRQAAGITEADPPPVALAKLTALLPGDEAAPIIAGINQLLGLGGEPAPVEEMAWAARKVLEAVAKRSATIVVIDDLHCAETTFLDVIDHICDWSRDAPILIVCVARPELLDRRPAGAGKPNATSIRLDPLSERESDLLLEHLLGQRHLGPEIKDRITGAAEGNPLFVEEMLSVLIDDGLFQLVDGAWKATVDAASVGMPPSIQALLAARIDQLDPPDACMLQRVSVLGVLFEIEAATAISPPADRALVPERLYSLVRRDLLRVAPPNHSGRDMLQFRHALVREAAYASLPKWERASVHESCAAWLTGTELARGVDQDELIGHHLEAAYLCRSALGPAADASDLARKAAVRLAAAGRRALAREDMPAAASFLSRAGSLFDDRDPTRPEVLHQLATALIGSGQLARADEVLTEAISTAGASDDPRLEGKLLVGRLRLKLQIDPAGTVERADREARSLMTLFESTGDEEGLARAWHLLASVNWTRCRAGATEDALLNAILHARAAGDEQEEQSHLGTLASMALFGPTPAPSGISRCEDLLARAGDRRSLEGRVVRALAGLHAMQGDFDQARDLIERSIAIFEDLGLARYLAGAMQLQGIIEMMADNPLAAEPALRRSYELLCREGATAYASTSAAALADALHSLGRDQEAEQLIAESRDAAHADDAETQIQWRAVHAKILARRGDIEEAGRLASEAEGLARGSDISFHADRLIDVGDVLFLGGHTHAALSAVAQAVALCEAKGNTVWADRARRRLAAMTARSSVIV